MSSPPISLISNYELKPGEMGQDILESWFNVGIHGDFRISEALDSTGKSLKDERARYLLCFWPPDIVALTESFLPGNVPDSSITNGRYHVFPLVEQDQQKWQHDGISIGILGVLKINSRPHGFLWPKVRHGQGNIALLITC